jgi:NADPH-dependent 2,4-dienoyl-CoA reductase/sulfur reductase-like enzyme/rhodanese-related sulfurtransferase
VGYELAYDALILAPGSQAADLPVPGLDNPDIYRLRTVDDAIALRSAALGEARADGDDHSIAGKAVVIGAGFIGLEVAEALNHQGWSVCLLEAANQVLPPLEQELASLLTDELTRLGVARLTSASVTGVTDRWALADQTGAEAPAQRWALDLTTASGGSGGGAVGSTTGAASANSAKSVKPATPDSLRLETDLLVLAVGNRPATDIFVAAGGQTERGYITVDDYGRTSLTDVYAAGDACLSRDAVTGVARPVPLAGPANRAGRLVADSVIADQLGGRLAGANDSSVATVALAASRPPVHRRLPTLLGTAIVRVGRLTVAMTGANRAALRAAGLDFITIHLHPNQHAGYFPGATPIHLLVHLDPESGLILGAQAVGGDGVDKRIDLLSMAIRSSIPGAELVDLDLAYAPPYGSAKDPITMVGLMIDNLQTGQLRLWSPEQLDWARSDAVLLLDVRSPAEFASGHLPEAVNIAHTELRSRLGEVERLAAGRPIAVLCQSGVRSYIAHRILASAGFDSSSLSGGMSTLKAWLGSTADIVMVTS